MRHRDVTSIRRRDNNPSQEDYCVFNFNIDESIKRLINVAEQLMKDSKLVRYSICFGIIIYTVSALIEAIAHSGLI